MFGSIGLFEVVVLIAIVVGVVLLLRMVGTRRS
jgi:TfoX/Sxy family transcriptional regulator of competence genes